jgi:replicative DNA helicase
MRESKRVPQHLPLYDLEAEQSVLGGVLLDNDVLPVVLEILRGDEFYRGAHRIAFAAVIALFERKEPCDLVTLTNILKSQNKLEDAGGDSYLASLLDRVRWSSASDAVHDARIIREKYVRRWVTGVFRRHYKMAFNENVSLEELLERLDLELEDLREYLGVQKEAEA